ncbi:MAG TPA: hypothetical protein VGN14_01575 [Candidatus Elarobacter sp.]|jgi:hypothetical protein
MKPLVLAASLALSLALGTIANAQTVPLGTAPPPNQSATANLIFQAMMAQARAASTNPSAAQAAQIPYQHAVQAYNTGDMENARAQAIQAMIEANRAANAPIPVLKSTIPTTSALQTNPFPLAGGTVGHVDADAFVAQARAAVAACRAAKSPNTNAAAANLAAAEKDDVAGRYLNVTSEAKAAVDLCASVRR